MVLISKTISDATQASPIVITTTAAHMLTTGDEVQIIDTAGMVEINDRWYSVTVLTTTTFSIPIDGTSYTTWSSGGTVKSASYSLNEDAEDMIRTNATKSKITVGDSASDNISEIKLDKIRSMVYQRVKGKLYNSFTSSDVIPSNMATENPVRYAEAKIVTGEYLKFMFGNNELTYKIAQILIQEGYDELQMVANGSIQLFDIDGEIITPTNLPSSNITASFTLKPISPKENGASQDISSLSGFGPDDEFYNL